MIAMRRCYAISIIGMEGKNMNHNKKKILKVTALFVFMFFLGWGAGSLQKQQMKKTVETVSVQNQADNWGLGFGAEVIAFAMTKGTPSSFTCIVAVILASIFSATAMTATSTF